MEILIEFLIFVVIVTVGICFMYFCCPLTSTRRVEPTQSPNPQRTRRFFTRSHKTDDDDPPPIFSITTMSNTSSTSRMNESREFVDICIDEQPPPHYDDVIVVKPPETLKPDQ